MSNARHRATRRRGFLVSDAGRLPSEGRSHVHLGTLLVSLFVLVDDWWKKHRPTRDGARQMLAAALLAEVAAYVESSADEHGRRLVVRNGYHAEREVTTQMA